MGKLFLIFPDEKPELGSIAGPLCERRKLFLSTQTKANDSKGLDGVTWLWSGNSLRFHTTERFILKQGPHNPKRQFSWLSATSKHPFTNGRTKVTKRNRYLLKDNEQSVILIQKKKEPSTCLQAPALCGVVRETDNYLTCVEIFIASFDLLMLFFFSPRCSPSHEHKD